VSLQLFGGLAPTVALESYHQIYRLQPANVVIKERLVAYLHFRIFCASKHDPGATHMAVSSRNYVVFYSLYHGYEENDERSNEEEKSTSSMPIGEGMNTGKLSNPVSDSSNNGIIIVGSISRPILERDQILAFVTLTFLERRLKYLPEIIRNSPASRGFD
jgi:hypothetical protein